MTKKEFMEELVEEIKGKGLSKSDLRFTFIDLSENAARDGRITESQRMRWCLTERELKMLKSKTGSCQC